MVAESRQKAIPGVDERTKIAKKVAAAGDRWLRKLPEGGIWGG